MEWRTTTVEEFPDFVYACDRSFGHTPVDDMAEKVLPGVELDRTLVALDNGQIVATGANYTFELAVPGGTLPVSGLTDIAVRSTHRRRGLLREMMQRLLDQSADREEAASVLIASESQIYGRFGYGVSAYLARYVVDPRHVEMTPPDDTGRLREIDDDEVIAVGAELWDRYWRQTPGEVSRSKGLWTAWLNAPSPEKGRRYHVVHEAADGTVDGWVAFHRESKWGPAGADGVLDCEWLAALNPTAHLALWHHLLQMDLVGEVKIWGSLDEPAQWRLDQPRRLRVEHVTDMTWTRLLDVGRCLAARSYPIDGVVVLDVEDRFRPGTGGRFRLEVVDGKGSVEPTRQAPDLSLHMPELATLWSGAASPASLVAAGRIGEHRPGAAATAAALFAVDPAPLCVVQF